MGYAEHRVVDTFAFQPAVAEDLPGLHPREGVLDAGPEGRSLMTDTDNY